MTAEITKIKTLQGFEVKEVNNSVAYIEAISKILLYASLEDAATSLKEDIPALEIFDSKEELEAFLRETEICSVCGEICCPDDECYSDYDTGDACCTKCCFYDERDDVYRKGDEEVDCIIEHFECKECNQRWFKRYSFDKVGAGDSMHIITSEDEDMLAAENKAMGDFLEKQIGFTQEDVTNIANSSKQLFCVHVVCNNTLEYYSLYTNEDKAKEKYIELCKEWYKEEGVENYKEFGEDLKLNEIEFYDNYYCSEEYHAACDYAHVTWEKLS